MSVHGVLQSPELAVIIFVLPRKVNLKLIFQSGFAILFHGKHGRNREIHREQPLGLAADHRRSHGVDFKNHLPGAKNGKGFGFSE
jgi:hypothetical protein